MSCLSHVTVLCRLRWWGSDHKKKNKSHAWIGMGEPPAEPPSLRRWASNTYCSQPFGCHPWFSRKRQQSRWMALGVGSSLLAGNRTHRCRLNFGWWNSSTLPLEQLYIPDLLEQREQEHSSLDISNWTFTWDGKSQSSVHWAKSNTVFHIKLPLAPLWKMTQS